MERDIMTYINVKEGDIPGTVIRDGQLYRLLCGRYVPVIGVMWSEFEQCFVPVLDLPQMSDEQWKELTREHPVKSWEG